jgi:hypothetical protein
MFVRWQYRSGSKAWRKGAWSAILVESKRVDGVPRQQHVAYLGGITVEYLKVDAQRCYFWDEINKHLDRLGNRIAGERSKIEASIALKVPRASPEEYKEIARRTCASLGWNWLSKKFKEALKDEAEQWQSATGTLAGYGHRIVRHPLPLLQ